MPIIERSLESRLREIALLVDPLKSKNIEYRLIGGEFHVYLHGSVPMTSEAEKTADVVMRIHKDGRREVLKNRDGPLAYPLFPQRGTEWAYSEEFKDQLIVQDVLDE